MSDPKVAIITVTHETGECISTWLNAVLELLPRDDLEICVVDSGSSSDERDELRRRVGDSVDVLLLERNLGFGRCSNEGVRATRAPVLLFSNPDTAIQSLPSIDAESLEGRIVGAINRVDRMVVPLGFAHLPTVGWEARQLLLGRWSSAYRSSGVDPAWVSGSALIITRRDFECIGGFSADYFLYFEDADLCDRHRAEQQLSRFAPSTSRSSPL